MTISEILGIPCGYVLGTLIFKCIKTYIKKKRSSVSKNIRWLAIAYIKLKRLWFGPYY